MYKNKMKIKIINIFFLIYILCFMMSRVYTCTLQTPTHLTGVNTYIKKLCDALCAKYKKAEIYKRPLRIKCL